MSRAFMYDAVMEMPTINTVFGNRVMSTGAGEGPGGDDDAPDTPFVIIRAATTQPPVLMSKEVKVKQSRFQVWLHNSGGDTTPVDVLQMDLENLLPDKAPVRNDDGWIMDCRWEETSPDGYDDHYKTNTRYVTFLVTWRPA